MSRRASPYAVRRAAQAAALPLPLFPTTTIGSFPQTQKVRAARAERRAGTITPAQYEKFLEEEIARTVRLQESIGLDVLVHGEFERNDMVEYFGEMLSGFAFTRNGWVQSYGSRCVKPPVIFGDVERPKPMTVRWSSYAQSLTRKAAEGHAHRAGDHPRVVVRPRRPAPVPDLPPDCPCHPRRGRGISRPRASG